MNRDINLNIEFFKNSMVDTINNSGLEIGIVYYVLKDILKDFEGNYFDYLNSALQEEREKIKQQKIVEQNDTVIDE